MLCHGATDILQLVYAKPSTEMNGNSEADA
jgi:hypothetical protein